MGSRCRCFLLELRNPLYRDESVMFAGLCVVFVVVLEWPAMCCEALFSLFTYNLCSSAVSFDPRTGLKSVVRCFVFSHLA